VILHHMFPYTAVELRRPKHPSFSSLISNTLDPADLRFVVTIKSCIFVEHPFHRVLPSERAWLLAASPAGDDFSWYYGVASSVIILDAPIALHIALKLQFLLRVGGSSRVHDLKIVEPPEPAGAMLTDRRCRSRSNTRPPRDEAEVSANPFLNPCEGLPFEGLQRAPTGSLRRNQTVEAPQYEIENIQHDNLFCRARESKCINEPPSRPAPHFL